MMWQFGHVRRLAAATWRRDCGLVIYILAVVCYDSAVNPVRSGGRREA